MSKDVFVWRMSAVDHRSAVLAFRQEIVEHHRAQSPFPISLITALLPIKSDQIDVLNDRGEFDIKGDRFTNAYSEETVVTIDDPTMKQYDIVIPETWKGEISVNGDDIKIIFDPQIELHVPRLSELGVGRSEFQLYASIEGDEKLTASRLIDKTDPSKETIIEVELENNAPSIKRLTADATRLIAIDAASGSCGGGDPNATDWYVYRRRSDGLGFVHEGTIIEGGDVGYEYRFGPSNKAACDNWLNQNCPDGPCP